MAQPSVASYFTTRKRSALEELKLGRARKILNLGDADQSTKTSNPTNDATKLTEKISEKTLPLSLDDLSARVVVLKDEAKTKTKVQNAPKKVAKAKRTKKVEGKNQDIQKLFHSLSKTDNVSETPTQTIIDNANTKSIDLSELHKTPPSTPTKINAMDKLKMTGNELNLKEIKQKLCRSNRLAELKASISRFKENDAKLKHIEKLKPKDSPNLKAFKSLELEVNLSPQKVISPQKAYLSPRKESTARRNLLNQLTPTKNAVSMPQSPSKALTMEKHGLTLPFKYRTLAEMFRSIDTVCQIMYNRKETITFKKLKPAVEEMIKRNLTEKHLGQIRRLFGEAFRFKVEKLKAFGIRQESWELVIEPTCTAEAMTSEFILERRRKFFQKLIGEVHVFHREFLLSLEPPMDIKPEKITRWHAAFDIERVPDIETTPLPQPPEEEKFSSGKDVLERAKLMFNCNTRMEKALERLKEAREKETVQEREVPKVDAPVSVLKGIPKALLEKVRQKQAAKALVSMTRSDEQDKELQLYSHLPELARLTRNLFVSEKKSVLPIETVLDKLTNSIRSYMTRTELEERLKHLERAVPGWIVFHNIRNCLFIKISKNADLSLVLDKLDKLIKLKSAA